MSRFKNAYRLYFCNYSKIDGLDILILISNADNDSFMTETNTWKTFYRRNINRKSQSNKTIKNSDKLELFTKPNIDK